MANSTGDSFLNPLGNVRIGSIYRGDTGVFGATVISGKITSLETRSEGADFISGTSLYSNNQNTFSLKAGASGGVMTGPVAVSAGVSAGYSSAHTNIGQSMSLGMNAMRYSGIEYVKFNELDQGELMQALSNSAKAELERVLDLFIKANEARDTDEFDACVSEWQLGASRFRQRFGDGIVVGVAYGGWGQVKLNIELASKNSAWKFSQTANVSVSGIAASGSVSESLGVSQRRVVDVGR